MLQEQPRPHHTPSQQDHIYLNGHQVDDNGLGGGFPQKNTSAFPPRTCKMPTITDNQSSQRNPPSGGSSLLFSSRGGFRGNRADMSRKGPPPARNLEHPDARTSTSSSAYPVVFHSTTRIPPMPEAPLGRPPYLTLPAERPETMPWPLISIIPPRAPPAVNSAHGDPMYCLHGPTIYVMRPLANLSSWGIPTSDTSYPVPRPTPQHIGLDHHPGYSTSVPGTTAPVAYHDQSRFMSSSSSSSSHHIIVPTSNQGTAAVPADRPEKHKSSSASHHQPRSVNSTSQGETKASGKAKAAPRQNKPKRAKSVERAYRKGMKYQNDSFPMKLHRLLLSLENTQQKEIAGFSEDGKSFYIHDKVGLEQVLPTVFRHGKFLSFKRLLYMYGFECTHGSWTKGMLRHPQFCRDDPGECRHMVRINSTASKMGYKKGKSDDERDGESSSEAAT